MAFAALLLAYIIFAVLLGLACLMCGCLCCAGCCACCIGVVSDGGGPANDDVGRFPDGRNGRVASGGGGVDNGGLEEGNI